MKKNPAKQAKKRIAKAIAPLMVMVTFHQNTGFKTGNPGMKAVYWTPLSDVTAFPTIGTTYTAPGDTANSSGAWTCTDGFVELKNDLFKGSELKLKSNGDLRSPSIVTNLETDVIGFDTELIERFRDIVGVPGVLVVEEECNPNVYYVVGDECNPVLASFDFGSDRVGGTNGKKWAVVFECNKAAYKWTQGVNTLPLRS